MTQVFQLIEGNIWIAWAAIVAAFAVLAKCADIFVESSVALAERFNIPKLVIGIVLVSFATTAPELSVSAMSALQGAPEIALGNAIGSVICNAGLALSLCALVSAAPIAVDPRLILPSSLFTVVIAIVCFLCVAFDYSLSRLDGVLLVTGFAGYIGFLLLRGKGRRKQEFHLEELENEVGYSMPRILTLFVVSLAGILIASKFIVVSATTIARAFQLPESVIALTLVALGTSIPEVATCVTASLKRHGELAVGNILGANVMNICWVAGASAIINELPLGRKEIYFMFPSMFVLAGAMLLILGLRKRLTRLSGSLLLVLYVVYLVALFTLFPPQLAATAPVPR